MVTVQRYNSFFNVQIFWEKFLVRDREIDLLNSIRVPIVNYDFALCSACNIDSVRTSKKSYTRVALHWCQLPKG